MDWPYNELIADYDKVNFVIMLTWMSYIVMFLTGRRNSTALTNFKRVWKAKKFSYLYEGRPKTNSNCFMQSLFLHCIGMCWFPGKANFWNELAIANEPSFSCHFWTIFYLIVLQVIWLLKVLYTEDCLGFTAFTVCLSVSHTSHSSRSTCPLVVRKHPSSKLYAHGPWYVLIYLVLHIHCFYSSLSYRCDTAFTLLHDL